MLILIMQFFTHERGKFIALYALALGYSNGIAPLIMGFINDGQGYKWVFVSISTRDIGSFESSNRPLIVLVCYLLRSVTPYHLFLYGGNQIRPRQVYD